MESNVGVLQGTLHCNCLLGERRLFFYRSAIRWKDLTQDWIQHGSRATFSIQANANARQIIILIVIASFTLLPSWLDDHLH